MTDIEILEALSLLRRGCDEAGMSSAETRMLNERVRQALLAPAIDVERLARAMHRTENPDGGECSDLMGKHGHWAQNLALEYAKG